MTLTDADTGERIVTGFKLSITLGTDTGYEGSVIEADVTALVNEDGEILGEGKPLPRAEADGRYRTGVFRFAVAEMRVAAP